MLPALKEVAVVLRKAGWQCEVRAGDKDPGVHFTVYRAAKAGVSGGEKPFMTYQPEKQNNTVLVNVATKAFAAPVGSFALDKITEDFVQTEATMRALPRKSVSCPGIVKQDHCCNTMPRRRLPLTMSFSQVPMSTGSRRIQFSWRYAFTFKFGYHCN